MNKQQLKFKKAVVHCHKVTKTPSDFGMCVGDKLTSKSKPNKIHKMMKRVKAYGIGYVRVS